MSFIPNSVQSARQQMLEIAPALADKYASVIQFLSLFPETASKKGSKKSGELGSIAYIANLAGAFARGREVRSPNAPSTVPDDLVSVILNKYFDEPLDSLAEVSRTHALSMGAENIVGDLLERYLAFKLEPLGWVWCSGSMIKAIDFIKPPTSENNQWRVLQVKNRDNSENSSSKAIRDGTTIEKWHRCFSRTGATNWENFPDVSLTQHLTEAKFKAFVLTYLKDLKKITR